MAAIITSMLIIPRKPSINLSTFHMRTLASKRCRISSNAAATSFKTCSSQRSIDVKRRSGNYKSPFWDFDYIQSLNTEYKEERHLSRASALKVQVKMLMEEAIRSLETVEQLELIDNLQSLGISYHFEDQIKNILNAVHNDKHGKNYQTMERNLYSTALEFRLLRQHGFEVSQEVFDDFKNMEDGEFKASLGEDTKGLLQLYESSFLLTQGENTLDQAREFATKFLQKNLDQKLIIDENLLLLVHHALEIPLHRSVPRTNARWFIEAYEKRSDMNPIVLELAKLDFNIVQAIHQEELKRVSRWWKELNLVSKLPYLRDRIVECYFWAVALHFEPQYSPSRLAATKIIVFTSVLNDTYDSYATFEEVDLFTEILQRWDTKEADALPNYMKIAYKFLSSEFEQFNNEISKQGRPYAVSYAIEAIKKLARGYHKKAKWYMGQEMPTFQDHISNGVIVGGCEAIVSGSFMAMESVSKEAFDWFVSEPKIVEATAKFNRYMNDTASYEREHEMGQFPGAVDCYMTENGVSKQETLNKFHEFAEEEWKTVNKEWVVSCAPRQMMKLVLNYLRCTYVTYKYGEDTYTNPEKGLKQYIVDLFVNPILI